MTALADMLSRRDHERLLERLDELAEIDRKMRQPGALAAPRDERGAIPTETRGGAGTGRVAYSTVTYSLRRPAAGLCR